MRARSTLIRSVKTDEDGRYSDTYSPNVVGSWSVEASWEGGSFYNGSTSDTVMFAVEKAGDRSILLYGVIMVGLVFGVLLFFFLRRRR